MAIIDSTKCINHSMYREVWKWLCANLNALRMSNKTIRLINTIDYRHFLRGRIATRTREREEGGGARRIFDNLQSKYIAFLVSNCKQALINEQICGYSVKRSQSKYVRRLLDFLLFVWLGFYANFLLHVANRLPIYIACSRQHMRVCYFSLFNYIDYLHLGRPPCAWIISTVTLISVPFFFHVIIASINAVFAN